MTTLLQGALLFANNLAIRTLHDTYQTMTTGYEYSATPVVHKLLCTLAISSNLAVLEIRF
jgi:hypothetical protein